MGFTKPNLPAVDPDAFLQKPLMERMHILALSWAENGFGSPRMVHTVYIAKLVLLYALGGVLVAFDKLIQTFPLDKINDAIDSFRSGRVVKPVLLTGEEPK